MDKQHSLNEFTLQHIFTKLLEWSLDDSSLYTLQILQRYRDKYKDDDYFDIEYESFLVHFSNVKFLLNKSNEKKESKEFINLSQKSLEEVWNNEEDSVYDKFL